MRTTWRLQAPVDQSPRLMSTPATPTHVMVGDVVAVSDQVTADLTDFLFGTITGATRIKATRYR